MDMVYLTEKGMNTVSLRTTYLFLINRQTSQTKPYSILQKGLIPKKTSQSTQTSSKIYWTIETNMMTLSETKIQILGKRFFFFFFKELRK